MQDQTQDILEIYQVGFLLWNYHPLKTLHLILFHDQSRHHLDTKWGHVSAERQPPYSVTCLTFAQQPQPDWGRLSNIGKVTTKHLNIWGVRIAETHAKLYCR